MRRFLPHLLVLLGCAIVVAGFLFLSSASIPYQDATSEMLARQQREVRGDELAILIGLIIAAAGVWVGRRGSAVARTARAD